jgi:hypothetical protein
LAGSEERADGPAYLSPQDESTRKGGAAASASGAVAQVEAAAASDALEALEAVLPEAAKQLMALAAAHAAAGPRQSFFAARQLLGIAARCVDLSDASARGAAMELIKVHSRSPNCANGIRYWTL